MSEGAERRLVAILSADAVGYTKLMADDEAATVGTITAYREEFARGVTRHAGRIVDAPGDNVLAEFPTATGALTCALEMQRLLAARNAGLSDTRRMEFRIGLHVGEVRVDGGRLYGDAVNIAARLEPLAQSGGICLSAEVRAQTLGKLDVGYEDLGEHELKNVAIPVHVYRVSAQAAPRHGVRRSWLLAGAAGAVLVAAAAVWLSQIADNSGKSASDLERELSPSIAPVTEFGSRPAIAVLPFDNFSGDPEQEYFADGIAEDLITRLASWRSFPVIARNSSFVYKGRAVDVKQVSRELGARYIVEGSVRRAANRVRITAQVVDASTGHHVWAETYDRELTDVFAVQDEISTAIAASTQGGLQRMEGQSAARQEPRNLAAWDLLQRARWQLSQSGQVPTSETEALVLRVLELEPSLAAAHGLLARIRYRELTSGAQDPGLLDDLLASGRRAIELDPLDAENHLAMALGLSLTGDRPAIAAAARRAVELNPSMPVALAFLGTTVAIYEGRLDEGLALIERALRINPTGSTVFAILDQRVAVEIVSGDYQSADATVRNMIQRQPEIPWPHFYRAVILWHLGRADDARQEFDEARRLGPGITLRQVRQAFSFIAPAAATSVTQPLEAMGLPES